MADAHPDDSGAPPVTICCAASDGAAVREAAEALVARGHQVELAVGVDVDSGVLTRAIATLRGRGLYVLCRSHSLDRNAVDDLREILRTHDVPFGRTLTLAVDTQRPREVEERIISVLRRMVTGRADGRPRAWGTNAPTHEEDPDTTIRRPGGSPAAADPSMVLVGLGTEPENADPYASTSQIEVRPKDSAPAPLPYTGAEHTAIGPAPQAPAATGATRPPGAAPAVMPMVAPPPPMPGGPVSMGAPPPMPGGPGPMMALAPMPSGPVAMDAPPVMPSAPVPLFSPAMSMGSSPGMSDALAAYTPPPVSSDESSADFDAMTTGGRMGRALGSPAGLAVVIGGLVLVVLVVVLTTFVLGDDESDAAQASAATANDAASKAPDAKKADAKKADAKKAGDAKTDATKGSDDDGAGKANGTAAKPEPAEPEPAEPEPTPQPDPDAAPEPRWAAAADPGDALPARTFAPEDDPPEVIAALKSREVRAIDVFLVAPERKGTLTYEQAVGYCSTLEIAGLRDWRVPAIGELNAAATAKMLGKAIYWSMTPGDSFGDLRLVLGTKKSTTIVAVPKSWDGAKIVCIRPRQP